MKEPIRILQIVPNMQAGGLENFIMNIYRNIDRDKVQFDFLVHYETRKHFDDEIEAMGGHIYRFSIREDKNIFRYLKQLNTFFRDHFYPVIHCHMSSFGALIFLIAKKHGVKVCIAHSHNSAAICSLKGITIHLLMLPYKYISTINFACSGEAGQYTFGKKPFTIIPNAIDTAIYSYNENTRNQIRKKLQIENCFVLGHVGRFNVQKNHKLLIQIFSEIKKIKPNAILLLLGTGELLDKTKNQVKELGLTKDVLFIGVQKNANEYYQAFDSFILPSLSEGLPLVGIEAQASGLPCFFTDKITKEIVLTDLITLMDITRPAKELALNILNNYHLRDRKSYNEQVEKTQFNIHEIAGMLEHKYLKYYQGE